MRSRAGSASFSVVAVLFLGWSPVSTSVAAIKPTLYAPAWYTAPWPANEKPYANAAADIDLLACTLRLHQTTVGALRQAHLAKPNDAVAAFRYAYAAWRLLDQAPAPRLRFLLLQDGQESLADVPDPHVYLFTRLRFLYGCYRVVRDGVDPQAKRSLAQRLAQRDPNDFLVVYLYATMLDPRLRPSDKALGLKLTHHLLQLDPQRASPSVYSIEAGLYDASWRRTKSQSDRLAAINDYQTYCRLARPGDAYRAAFEGRIRVLEASK